MFDEKVLRDLAGMEAKGSILSVYLDVDSKQRTSDEYKLVLREMLRQVDSQVDSADIEAVKRYVDLEYDFSGRGLALFSCKAENIWYAIVLAVPVRSGVTVAAKPYISPLVELGGLYGRYAVALIDRQGARFFLFNMGELEAQEGVMGEEIRHTRRGSGSSMAGIRAGAPDPSRKEAELVQRNLKETVESLAQFCQRYRARRLMLAGTEQLVAQIPELLPQPLREALSGSFVADMEANEVEIRDHSLAVIQELQEQRKRALVDTVITTAAKGSNGVIRLGETLSAAHEGRIQVLVLEREFHAPGYRCSGCGYLTAQVIGEKSCPFCGQEFHEIPDAAEAVVSQVVEKGGSVEVVQNSMLAEAGIGALLRY